MQTIKLYQVDAFSHKTFSGNPAAICPLNKWIDDELMQKIAMENNLAETAFFVANGKEFDLRWFTPVAEVDLCGHATLAAAHVLFNHLDFSEELIVFNTRSGKLNVRKENEFYTMNFPTDKFEKVETPKEITQGLDVKPLLTFKGKDDYMVLLSSQEAIKALQPDFRILAKLPARGIIATAKGNKIDFVSRCFFPQVGIDEDPVTGSAHTILIPYWADELNKPNLEAIQLSSRKGYLRCKHLGDRVEISGQAVTFLIGDMFLREN